MSSSSQRGEIKDEIEQRISVSVFLTSSPTSYPSGNGHYQKYSDELLQVVFRLLITRLGAGF
jgi:hypothetical protein